MYYGNVAQFQLYDSLCIENKGLKIEDMVLEAANAVLPYLNQYKKILIICGHGNNGADGLALATLIKNNVTVFIQTSRSQANQFYYNQCKQMNIPIISTLQELKTSINQVDVIVDALLGTGFKGQLNDLSEITSLINQRKNKASVICVDIPSGVNGDNGTFDLNAVKANQTISFLASKTGFLNLECHHLLGDLHIEKIIYQEDIFNEVGFSRMMDKNEIVSLFKSRQYNGFKGTYGMLSCYTGSKQYPGAALLSVGAALHTGCGMVNYCGDDLVKQLLISKYPEVIYYSNKQPSAILFGCGKGWYDETLQELNLLLQENTCPMVVDADGINVLSEHLELLNHKKSPLVLTPHIGEMQRLKQGNPILSAIQFCREYEDVVIVLKGSSTIVTNGKEVVRIPSGHKAMAVAGMGDCLAGIIASLLAQGYSTMDAAILGTYIHGCCGEKIAKNQYTVLPSNLIQMIPQIMHEIEMKK